MLSEVRIAKPQRANHARRIKRDHAAGGVWNDSTASTVILLSTKDLHKIYTAFA